MEHRTSRNFLELPGNIVISNSGFKFYIVPFHPLWGELGILNMNIT